MLRALYERDLASASALADTLEAVAAFQGRATRPAALSDAAPAPLERVVAAASLDALRAAWAGTRGAWMVARAPAPPFLCAVTRYRDERARLREFIDHHLREGVDRILVLDDRSAAPPRVASPSVVVRRVLDGVEIKMFRIRSAWSIGNGCGERDRPQTSRDLGSRDEHSVSTERAEKTSF